jgi:4-hydroxy-tetrahydrodipicolinate synthase
MSPGECWTCSLHPVLAAVPRKPLMASPLSPLAFAASTLPGTAFGAGVRVRSADARPPRRRAAAAGAATARMTVAQPAAAGIIIAEPLFGRVATAMVTPFKVGNGEVDYAVAEQLAAYLVENGSDALVIGGTTGESPTLTWSEQYELFSVVQSAVGDKAKIIAGAGSNSTYEAIEATRRAAKMGLDGTLQVTPYYNKPPQEGMYQHFKAIAEAEPDLPVMLYNIPGRTGINMSPEVTIRLSEIPNIVACKQACDSLDELVTIRKHTASDFHLYAGDDGMTLPFMSLGASGIVSVASHFVGNEIQGMIQKFLGGDVAGANAVHMKYERLFIDLFCMTNPIPTKTALRLQGWAVGGPRLPLVDAPPEIEEKLRQLLKSVDLL